MQFRKIPHVSLVAVMLLAAVAALATPAAAQNDPQQTTVNIVATPYSEPIRPLSDFAQIPITIEYNYPAYGAAFLQTPISIQVVEKPTWVMATVTPSTVFAPVDTQSVGSAQKTSTVSATLLVQTTADAPAFTQGTIRLRAQADANGDLAASQQETTTSVVADYFSILDATTPALVVKARPQQQVDIPITVTNLGNAATSIFLNSPNADAGKSRESMKVILPGTVTVESKQQGAKNYQREIIVSAQAPWRNGYINEPGVLQLDISSAYALDTKQTGMQTRVNTLITTKGFFVPGFNPVIIMAGLGAMAVLMRRRLEDADA